MQSNIVTSVLQGAKMIDLRFPNWYGAELQLRKMGFPSTALCIFNFWINLFPFLLAVASTKLPHSPTKIL